MKWITLLLIVATSPAYSQANSTSKEQYTEGECVLLTQEVLQYERRYGKRSSLYQKSKKEFDEFCDKPVKKLPRKVLLQMAQDKKNKQILEKLKQQQEKKQDN